jgi:hypothetical protein
MMERPAALATLLQHLRFSTVDGARCKAVHCITVRPKGGIVVNVTPVSTGG